MRSSATGRDRLGTTTEIDGLHVCVTPGSHGTAQVSVSGEIDFQTAPGLRAALLTALSSYEGAIDVDLAEVAFCDCTGLNVLLAARARALRVHRILRVTATSRPVARLLDLTGTLPLLTQASAPAVLDGSPASAPAPHPVCTARPLCPPPHPA